MLISETKDKKLTVKSTPFPERYGLFPLQLLGANRLTKKVVVGSADTIKNVVPGRKVESYR